jgi:hypothetical protein
MPVQRDYILRLLESIAAVIRRLREQLAGGAAPEVIIEESRVAQGELFGQTWAIVQRVDITTVLALIQDARQLSLYAELLQLEAEARRATGDDAGAQALETRAATIRTNLAARAGEQR